MRIHFSKVECPARGENPHGVLTFRQHVKSSEPTSSQAETGETGRAETAETWGVFHDWSEARSLGEILLGSLVFFFNNFFHPLKKNGGFVMLPRIFCLELSVATA